MRIVVHGDNNDRPKDVTGFAELVDNFVNDECGDVTVTAVQSLAHREREALNTAIGRLEALGIESDGRVYVDDENRHPSYARSYQPPCNTGHAAVDDEELDHAVAWLPSEAFQVDQSEGPYNPYITINHLRALEVLMMKTPDTCVVDGPQGG